jgi:glycosyltransferase involved in cell wall biosynthesis
MSMTRQTTDNLLSIIIPNHNYGQFIAETIACIAAQDYAPIELIVVDDASTDNSVEVINKAVDELDLERVEVITVPENVGKLGAINHALDIVQGSYCMILDADDYVVPGYVTRLIGELDAATAKDPKIAFVYTDCNLIDAKGEYLDRGKSITFDAEKVETLSYIPEPAIVQTKIMLESYPYDVKIRKGTKHHKWKRIVGNGWKGQHIPEPLFSYRMHENNMSGIGKKVMAEVDQGKKGHVILSGYWPTETEQR